MRLVRNTTDFPDIEIRNIIRLVRPPGISNFTVLVQNKHNYDFKSLYFPSRNHLRIGIGKSGLSFPYIVEKRAGGYQRSLFLSKMELLVHNIAHELRHAWQSKHTRGRVWGAKGKYSDVDAEAYAIQKVRQYRRLHQPKDMIDLLPFLFPTVTVKNTYFESKVMVKVAAIASGRQRRASDKPKSAPASYKVQKLVTFFHCLRCGKEWIPRFPDKEPTVCKFCKNPYWNKPREK